jgi:hypothetical protein
MSLHTLAQHLQSAGRGEDKVLVHMTPGEVNGLQSLAMAHGGSLTINPQTGLPEAGFLSALLPIAAGAMLGPAGVGLSAMQAGVVTGLAGAAMTGSLGKGLMMGLGAYGGAGLGEGLLGAAGSTAAQVGQATSQNIAAQAAANQAAAQASQIGQTMGAVPAASTTVPIINPPVPSMAGVQAQSQMLGQAPVVSTGTPNAPVSAPSVETATQSAFDRMKSLPGKAWDMLGSGDAAEQQRKEFWEKYKRPLMATGVATLALSRDEQDRAREAPSAPFNPSWNRIMQSGGNYQAGPYTGSSERRYFADGGLANLPVERMSQQNMTGSSNQNYPMARTRPYGYSVPRNNPISTNVIKPMDYEDVDPYTGEQRFAGGGLASLNMATGGFVSKLKEVKKPTETKPKLQDVSGLEKKIKSLEKYSNADDIKARYDDLQGQIKELQASKKERDAQAVQAKKDYEASIAAINKEKAANLKSVNDDFASRIKGVQSDKGMTAADKKAAIASLQKEQKEAQTGLNTDFSNRIKDRQNEYKSFQTDLTNFNKEYTTNLANLNKQAGAAKGETGFAKQYQDTVAQRDKIIAANEKLTNTAREKYEAEMSKYNEYQDALNSEKQAWQEETGRKATGLQAIKPQTVTKAAVEEKEGTYTPKYVKDPVTGKLVETSSLPPVTEFKAYTKVPGFDPTKKILEESDITAVFEDVAGRRPTQAEMSKLLGTVNSQAGLAAFAMKLPDVAARVSYTDDDIKENWNYYIGRDPTAGELANVRSQVKAGKIVNFNQMRNYIQNRPQYLENINKIAQSQFTTQQKTAQEALAEQQRLAQSLTPEQVSSTYRDVLGRAPTMAELQQYKGAQQTSEGLAGILKGTDEYMKSLTQEIAPTPVVSAPTVYAPKYAPGTVLEYTPPTRDAASGAGAITSGLQFTPSGLQTPLTRGAVTLEGAMPLNPTFQEQMGLQTLATQAAEKAPSLQTGMKFEAPQQNTFGFQPWSPNTSVEQALAVLRAQQLEAAKAAGQPVGMAAGGYAGGGYHLGDYSDGGRLLKGPGDGVSDSIPASIGGRQPARLADGEFVVPARIVSELGNGSTDAGARKLYAMMDRIQRARRKSVGKDRVAVDSKADKMLPA